MKKSVWQINQDAASLGMELAHIEAAGDDASAEELGATMERLEQYSADMPTKVLALHFAEDRLKAEVATLKGEIEIMQHHVRASQRSIDRVKALRVSLFHANMALVGDAGRKVQLPDKSSAWLVEQECRPKAVWDKRHEHLLPDSVKVEEVVQRIDKDLVLEWSESAETIYDKHGEPVVTIEWVDPTHTRRK